MSVIQGKLKFEASPLYDTYELAAAAASPTKIVFFENPTGASKNTSKTNLTEPFKLTPPDNFVVPAMRFVPIGMNEADLIALMKQYSASLIVSGREELIAPIEFWPGGGGPVITTEASGAGTSEYANNGIPDPRAIASVAAEPVRIETGETFRVELNGTTFTATAAVFLRVYLDGIWGKSIG